MWRSKISMSLTAALLLGMVSLTGCGTSNPESSNQVETKNVRGTKDGRIQEKSAQGDSFGSMEMSQELADRIAAMPEVRSANVMLAGKSAYVAVQLDKAEDGMQAQNHTLRSYSYGGESRNRNGNENGNGTSGMLSGSGRPMGMDAGLQNGTGGTDTRVTENPEVGMNGTRGSVTGNPGMTGTGGSMAGIPKSRTGTGTTGGVGMADPGDYPGNGGNGIFSGSNYVDGSRMSRDIDESMGRGRIGIRSTTPDNGSRMISGNDVTKEVKDKIAVLVKKSERNITNVYVSANPDFVERANVYADEFRAGHPLSGFAGEFRTMVERIFPTRSGS